VAVTLTGAQYAQRGDISVGKPLTNVVSGKEFTLSLWIKAEDGGGGVIFIGGNSIAPRIQLTQSIASGTYSIEVRNISNGTIWQARTATAYDDGEWHNVLISADLSTTTGHLLVDGISDEVTIVAPIDGTIPWTNCTELLFGAFFGGAPTRLTGMVESFWFATEYIDVSVEANRRLFYGTDGTQVGLGHQGRRPLDGRQPEIFLGHGPGNFGRNEGSGGDFDLVGSFGFDRGRPAPVNSLSRGFRGERWRESERSGIPFSESELMLEPASGLEVARREFSTDRDEINRNRRRRAFPE